MIIITDKTIIEHEDRKHKKLIDYSLKYGPPDKGCLAQTPILLLSLGLISFLYTPRL